jgi:hypothetical protein
MFEQNCLYSTQGTIICKDEEKSKQLLNGFPRNPSENIIEKFIDDKNTFSVPQISGKKLLKDQNDPASVGFVNANLISGPGQKPYSCSIDNCKTVCPTKPDNNGIFSCDLQCENCSLDGKTKASYKSKTNDQPIRIKKDGTPAYNIVGVPCVNINTNDKQYTTLSSKNTTCKSTTFAEYAQSIKNSVATEHFQQEEYASPYEDNQIPFYDQRTFKSFWSP